MAGRHCAVCTHPERAAIDAAILAGGAFRTIATRYEMSHPAVLRHRNSHMAEQLAGATEQREAAEPESTPVSPPEPPRPSRRQDVAEALDIVQQIKAVNNAALTVLRDARVAGDGRLVLLAVDRVQKQIELQARLIGQIDERPTITIWLSAEWQTIERTLVEALAPHPQARLAVVDRLQALRIV
jgi:hypothetical protein